MSSTGLRRLIAGSRLVVASSHGIPTPIGTGRKYCAIPLQFRSQFTLAPSIISREYSQLADAPETASATTKTTLAFVTGNEKKLKEVQQILSLGNTDIPFVLTNRKLDLFELQGDNPLEIAQEKCRLAAKAVGGPVLTEDTSLCFTALNGMPGPYIKWFLESCGHEGLNKMLDGFDDRTAYAQTVAAFTLGPDKEIHLFDGRTLGRIVRPRGKLNFGWDPIFEPDEGGGKTYAEMSDDSKNAISHRGRSFAKLKEFLATIG